MNATMSRRTFTTGAALGTAALTVGLASTAHADTPGITWDEEADFVVIGAGSAGIYGAINATEEGMSALIIEKQPQATAGGDSTCNNGLMYSPSNDANLVMGNYSFGRVNEDWAFDVEDEAAAAIQWLIDRGCTWTEGSSGAMSFFEGHGPAVYAALLKGLDEAGVPVHYETRATKLIQDADGAVIGVQAEQNGSTVFFKANKAVLIATGSYTCNKDLVEEFNAPGLEYYSVGAPYLTGDGLIMGAQVGARLSKMAKSLEYGTPVAKTASQEVGTGIFTVTPAVPSMLWVNGKGERFMNELTSFTHNKGDLAVTSYTGSMADYAGADGYNNTNLWEICDEACFVGGPLGNHTSTYSWAVYFDDPGYVWSADNLAELDRGWIVKADTIEELAQKIGVPADALAASVSAYNDGCAAGADAFGRSAESLAPIGDGPYYAMDLGVCVIYTIGGLDTDECSRTLNWEGNPIPRLYSAGNVGQVGTFLLPIGIPGCMAQAILAARDAATLEAWA